MTFRISLFVGLTCLLASGAARAQALYMSPGSEVSVGYQSLPAKAPGQTTGGIQLGEGALAHVGVGAEVGYDSNVFYGENNARGSAIARVIPFVEFTNAARNGVVPGDNFFDVGAALVYREYLSNDEDIKRQRAFMPNFYGNLSFGRLQSVSFELADSFARSEDPPYVQAQGAAPSEPITRDVNVFSTSVRWAPGGGRLAGVLRYMNTLDAFETGTLKVANSMGHLLGLDFSWKWLPKTALVLQVSQGYVSYFNSLNGQKKPTSYPFHAMAGIRGLITAKLTANLLAGYANGFYQMTRPGPSGFSGNFTVGADITYRPTVLTMLGLGYQRDFRNAVLGDFYYVDAIYLNFGQAIAGRVGIGLSARYESRSFQNVPVTPSVVAPMTALTINRHDNFIQAGANVDYHMRDWTYAGVAYSVSSNSSDYNPMNPQDPGRVNYVKHLLFARLGVTY